LLDEVVFDRESEVERMIDGPEHVESVVLSKVEVGALLAGSEGGDGLRTQADVHWYYLASSLSRAWFRRIPPSKFSIQ